MHEVDVRVDQAFWASSILPEGIVQRWFIADGSIAESKASILNTEGTGWDVGHAVKFLLSHYARYITGQVLVVDGGVTLQGTERDSQDR